MKLNEGRTKINTGMWVCFKGVGGKRTAGILHDIDPFTNTGEVHVVDEDGSTSLVVPKIGLAELEQAKLDDIPAARRPSEEAAKRLAYS